MSEGTTRQRIANMWNSITGVRTAFLQIPRVLQSAQLPASVIFPGAATYDTEALGDQMVLDTRLYEMILYVEEAAFGTSGQGELNTDVFFDQVRDFFLARPGLELPAQGAHQVESAYEALILGDAGLQVGSYPLQGQDSTQYVQVRWRLQVKEVAPITYAD